MSWVARGVYPSADASSAAPTGSGSSRAALTSFAAFSSWRCPRELASAPSSRFASGNSLLARRSCTLRDARASRHVRSEERRVGKECRARGAQDRQQKEKQE